MTSGEDRMVAHPSNVCAGPFGAAYDAYIERERIRVRSAG
jgi:hypothetical protein